MTPCEFHVITACSRPKNIPALSASLRPGRGFFSLTWWIVCPEQPPCPLPSWARWVPHPHGVAGQAQKNAALDQIADGWVWVLDDDNLVHPAFFARIAPVIVHSPGAAGIILRQVGATMPHDGRAVPEAIRVAGIDIAQCVFHRTAIGSLRIPDQYDGDGHFICAVAAEAAAADPPQPLIFLDEEPLAYYNALAGPALVSPSPRKATDLKVSLVVVAYQRPRALQGLLSSLLVQTHQHFEVLIYHDGPEGADEVQQAVRDLRLDERFQFFVTSARENCSGHTNRVRGFQAATGDVIGTTNDDNYYLPVYFEKMLEAMREGEADIVMSSYIERNLASGWQPLAPLPKAYQSDAGCWLAKAALVKSTPWLDLSYAGDGTFLEAMDAVATRTIRLEHVLFVHN